jgi:hypothetical protein
MIDSESSVLLVGVCGFEVYAYHSLGLWQELSGAACLETLRDTKIRASLSGS